ncbi:MULTISPECIES: riboflavin synthase [Mammaliicoccus]|uniref:riboflavin synthase n=1 Tax=Mammaliicoccus TaxID=2803850 RepID=UPI000E010E93|nr:MULTISPECIES: riboflavin synthase [Mammaliicoccus]RIL50587.1 riboflavin synthase [Mammaliicoccus fleurettii]RTX85647.1 riboflavin synthase [Mammaliicoccus fleurettii]SUM36322.1 riboflavin synthase subunit alpha [Mammaliicoccus fleurettii]HCN60570.1 riboflavin synthase [Staphylococcus sp.]
MFTGIIETVGVIKNTSTQSGVKTLTIEAPEITDDLSLGDSVAINGVCLTVTEKQTSIFKVEVITGTINVTYLEHLKTNDKVNLERAMLANGRFGGHFVSGHVDGKGIIKHISKRKDEWIIEISTDAQLLSQMIDKGSITVDGISLTIFKLYQHKFEIHLIPETRERTIFVNKKQGDEVHIETDLLFKYVQKINHQNNSNLSQEKLLNLGF